MSTITNLMPRRARFGLIFGAIGTTALLAAGVASLGAAGGAAVDAAAKAVTIKIDNFAFAPPDLTIAAGTTVTWKNEDGEVHKVQDDHKGFASAALDTDDSFSHTFATPGVYHYFCSIHPYMVGKIVVKPARPAS
jgi:plastocyanin